jgi:hypothetical protein
VTAVHVPGLAGPDETGTRYAGAARPGEDAHSDSEAAGDKPPGWVVAFGAALELALEVA